MEAFHIPPGYERCFLQMNLVAELVVVSFGTLNGPFGADDPFWTTDIVIIPPRIVRDLYGSRVRVDIPSILELPETSTTLKVSLGYFFSTTSYLYVGSDAQLVSPSSNTPFQMAQSTMVPCAMTIPSGNIVVNHAPIGIPRSSRPTPSLPFGYHALNPCATIHTQIPSRVPLGHNTSTIYIPTPSQVLSKGFYPPLHGRFVPSGSNSIGSTHHLLTFGYQILTEGQYYSKGQPQSRGHTQIGAPPLYGGHSQVGTYNSQSRPNTSNSLAHLWNIQGNPQCYGGGTFPATILVPPNYDQPYLGSLNPTWGSNIQSSTPFQGNIPNQSNTMGYMPPHHQLNMSGPVPYAYTAYVLLAYRWGFLPKATKILK
jgi:hypothetical protein